MSLREIEKMIEHEAITLNPMWNLVEYYEMNHEEDGYCSGNEQSLHNMMSKIKPDNTSNHLSIMITQIKENISTIKQNLDIPDKGFDTNEIKHLFFKDTHIEMNKSIKSFFYDIKENIIIFFFNGFCETGSGYCHCATNIDDIFETYTGKYEEILKTKLRTVFKDSYNNFSFMIFKYEY